MTPHFWVIRTKHLGLAILLACCGQWASAQDWAQRMFSEYSHDFGTVVRGSKPEYRFVVENPYKEDVEIESVRTSCRCVDVTFTQKRLKTWEKSEVVIKFNTFNFEGPRNATVAVRFSQPRIAEVQLKITGLIRRDLFIQPGLIDFGTGGVEQLPQQTVSVTRYGNRAWRIVDVRSAYSDVAVSLDEVYRGSDRVEYSLKARIKDSAAPGLLRGELLVVAQDGPQEIRFPIQFSGKINAALEVSPQILDLEVVQVGETVTKKIIIRGDEEFAVIEATCDCPAVSISRPVERKKVHVVEVTYVGESEPGPHETRIHIVTDLHSGETADLPLTVTVASQATAQADGIKQ